MSYTHAVTPDHPLCGTWFACHPDHPGALEQQVEYRISVAEGQFRIDGTDWSSGEEIIVCDVAYDGEWLRFQSLRPASGSSGRHWLRSLGKNRVEFHFTCTGKELLARKRFVPKTARAPSVGQLSPEPKRVALLSL